jgi:coenzyme F420 biosynthesis associated uncharacterized protein
MVDWTLAFTTAQRLMKPGPEISRQGAAQVVAELRDSATRAEAYVTSVTGLHAPSATAPVLVIDRPGWIQANIDAFRTVLAPLNEKAAERMQNSALGGVGARITGVEVGALLSYLAPRVLGQFDPFYPGLPAPDAGQDDAGPVEGAQLEPGGRLLLVAPNVVAVEREFRVDPADFRLWVCLHEETHRVQFAAVPWLRDYLNGQIHEVVASAELDGAALIQMVRDGVKTVGDSLRDGTELSIIDLVQTPGQREVVDRITAVMSLLEGHADVVMDSVGPEVISSVAEIRSKFTRRRQGQGWDRLVRKVLGLDAKLRQYRDGAEFCKTVINFVGMEGLNRVWFSPETLPSKAEIADPTLWLARVHADTPLA